MYKFITISLLVFIVNCHRLYNSVSNKTMAGNILMNYFDSLEINCDHLCKSSLPYNGEFIKSKYQPIFDILMTGVPDTTSFILYITEETGYNPISTVRLQYQFLSDSVEEIKSECEFWDFKHHSGLDISRKKTFGKVFYPKYLPSNCSDCDENCGDHQILIVLNWNRNYVRRRCATMSDW